MYHELTKKQIRKRSRKRIFGFLCIVALACACWFVSDTINANLREQGAVSVRNAILNSAKQACAIEGAYPTSIDYLVENYGLSINRNDYAITYQVFAENIMPNVVVLPK